MEPSQISVKTEFSILLWNSIGKSQSIGKWKGVVSCTHFQGVKENRANSRENYSGMKWMICFLAKSSAENILTHLHELWGSSGEFSLLQCLPQLNLIDSSQITLCKMCVHGTRFCSTLVFWGKPFRIWRWIQALNLPIFVHHCMHT